MATGFTDNDRLLLQSFYTQVGFVHPADKLIDRVNGIQTILVAIKAQTDKLTALQAEVDKLTAIQAQTDKLTAIKAKTDTITAGSLTPAQAAQITGIQTQTDKLTGIKSQTDKLTGFQTYLSRIDRGVGVRAGDRSVYSVVDAVDTLVRHADTNVVSIKAQTDTLPAIKAKTDTITSGGLTPAQATQITGIKSQTDKITGVQSYLSRIDRGVGIPAGERSVYFVVDAVDTLIRHVDTNVVPIKAQTDTLPAIKVQTDKITAIKTETDKITAIKTQTDKLGNVDTKVNEIHQRKALDGAKPVTFKGDGGITSTGMNIAAQELGDGSIKQTRQP